MGFHRLATPTYTGGLPGGYDYINDPPANGDPGVAAFADGKKSSGPNQGTYFVAFGEDATSSNTNRLASALAENTDFLDNLFHKDLALTARTADVTAGAPVASVVISGAIFVGAFGTPNNQDQRNRLISVLDSNDREVIDPSTGNTVVASLIHDGASTNVVGTQASGFYTNPTVNFSPSIPTGTVYRIYYGQRANLATLPLDAFTDIKIRGAQEVSGTVEQVLRDLHAAGGIQAWDSAWDSTIRALAAAGLDERYRRKRAVPGSFNFDTAGDGATIRRDGKALTVDVTQNNFDDPIGAAFKMSSSDSTAGFVAGRFAGSGFVVYAGNRFTQSANELGPSTAGGCFGIVWPHDLHVAGITNQKTKITFGLGATLNPGGAGGQIVELNVADFFHTGGVSAVNTGIDFIEILRNSGATEVYVITALNSGNARQCNVRTLGGTAAAFPADESVTVRWLTTMMWSGPNAGVQNRQATPVSDPVLLGGLQYFAPPPFLTSGTQFYSGVNFNVPYFGASGNSATYVSLAWGGYKEDATGGIPGSLKNFPPGAVGGGALNGDGSIYASAISLLNMISLGSRAVTISANTTVTWDPFSEGSCLLITDTVTVGNSATLTLNFAGGYSPAACDQIEVLFDGTGAGFDSALTINWPNICLFSDASDANASSNPLGFASSYGAKGKTKWVGTFDGTNFLMTKTSYYNGGATA